MVATLNLNIVRSRGPVGPDPSVINTIWRSAILDQHRYCDVASRVLARYPEEEIGFESMHYPDDETLAEMGINLDTLATCLDAGTITGDRVAELLAKLGSRELTVEEFDDAVALTLIPASVSLPFADRLTAAAHMPSVLEAARFHPDDHLDRALHAKGLCSCHVEFVA